MTTVLIVDDDKDIRHSLRDILMDDGYDTLEAGDGIAALDHLRQATQPLIALIDVSMPRLDGIGVIQHVRADTHLASTHAFIVMTARGRTLPLVLVQQMQHLNIQFLGKPFDIDHLLTIIDQAAQRLPS